MILNPMIFFFQSLGAQRIGEGTLLTTHVLDDGHLGETCWLVGSTSNNLEMVFKYV